MAEHLSPFEVFKSGGSPPPVEGEDEEAEAEVLVPLPRGGGRTGPGVVPSPAIEGDADEDPSPFGRFRGGMLQQREGAVEAFRRGAIQSTVQGGSLTAGALAGGKAGARAAAALPIPHPLAKGVAIVGGTIIGAGVGLFIGEVINEPLAEAELSIRNLEELREDLRGIGAAGQTFGGATTIGLSPLGLAKLGVRFGPSKAGNFLNRILDFAGKNPATFAIRETKAAAAAAVAGGVAVEAFPNQPIIRLGAELGGGAYHTLVFRLTKATGSGVMSLYRRLTPAGRQTRAGQILAERWAEAGEDPETFAALLAQLDFPGVETTAAQKIGSPAARVIEAEIAERLRAFSEPAKKMARDSLKALTNMLVLLRGTGDPAALREVARIRYRFFKTLLLDRVNRATAEATIAAQKITKDTLGARSELSVQAERIISNSLGGARKTERAVWAEVDHGVSLAGTKVLAGWDRLLGQVLPRKVGEFPEVIMATILDLRAAEEVLKKAATGEEVGEEALEAAEKMFTSGFYIKLRGELLSQVRQLDRLKFPNERRLLGELAEDVLDDLNDGFKNAPNLSPAVREAHAVASDYTNALNEVYTRTSVGAARATTATGARRIPPELLLEESLATGGTLGALRLKELREAVAFLGRRALDPRFRGEIPVSVATLARNFDLMLDIQGRLLRLAASESIETTGARAGRVSAKKLNKFILDNEELFDNLPPSIREDLLAAVKSEEGLRAVERATPIIHRPGGEVVLSAAIEREAAFTRILKVESGARAVEGALAGDAPLRSLVRMARLARRGGDEAVQGLRGAIWADAIRRASDVEGNVSLRELAAALTQPIQPGLPSLLQFMRNERVMGSADLRQVREIINRARTIGDALEVRPVGEAILGGDIADLPEAGLDTLLRIAGAQTGRQIAAITGGGTVQTPGIVAGLFKRVFGRLPKLKVMEVLKDAFLGAPLEPGGKQYGLLTALLEKPANAQKAAELARRVHAYAFMAGYTFLSNEDNFLLQTMPRDAQAEPLADTPADETADEKAEQALRALPPEDEEGLGALGETEALIEGSAAGGSLKDTGEAVRPLGDTGEAAEAQKTKPKDTVTDDVIDAVAQVESGGDVTAVGGAGELGQFQIIPATAADPGFGIPSIDLDTATEEEKAEWVQTYLQVALARFGTLELALASYNAGILTVDKIKGDITKLPKSTQEYLNKYRKLGILSSVLPKGEPS